MPSDEQAQLLARIRQFDRIARDAVAERLDVWKQNLDYYMGRQWDAAVTAKMASWRSTPVYNIVFEVVENVHAIVTDQRPQGFAYNRAKGTEEVARILSNHLEQLGIDLDLEAQNSTKWKDKLLYGTAFWKTWYDAEKGEVMTERVSPRNLRPDPVAADIDDCRYIIEEHSVPASDIVAQYPDKVDELLASTDSEILTLLEENRDGIIAGKRVSKKQIWMLDDAFEDDVAGKETVAQPAKRKRKYPNGRVVTWVGDVILQDVPAPDKYSSGRWPYTRDVLIEVPGEFWGISLVDVMLSQQDEVNQLDAMIFDNIRTVSIPILKMIRGAVDVNMISNSPGIIVEVDADTPDAFRREQGTPLPADVYRFREMRVDEARKMGGLTDALQGVAGASMRPGAVRAQIDSAMGRLREMIRHDNRALEDVGEKQLDLIAQHYGPRRMIAVSNDEETLLDLQDAVTQKEVQAALKDPRVQRELAGMRREVMVNDDSAWQAAMGQMAQQGVDEDTAREALQLRGMVEFQRDVKTGRYGYRVDIHPMQARDRESYQQTIMDLLRYGEGQIVDAKAVYDFLQLPGGAQIAKRIEARRNLQAENEQLKQQVQALSKQVPQQPAAGQPAPVMEQPAALGEAQIGA